MYIHTLLLASKPFSQTRFRPDQCISKPLTQFYFLFSPFHGMPLPLTSCLRLLVRYLFHFCCFILNYWENKYLQKIRKKFPLIIRSRKNIAFNMNTRKRGSNAGKLVQIVCTIDWTKPSSRFYTAFSAWQFQFDRHQFIPRRPSNIRRSVGGDGSKAVIGWAGREAYDQWIKITMKFHF